MSEERFSSRRRTFGASAGAGQFEQEVLEIDRVVRVVKGGRRFSFRASVIAGDRAGRVGFGLGKSRDIQAAIQKAYNQAVKNMVKISLHKGTIVREAEAKFKGARVQVRPARPGTGIVAGGTVRLVAHLAGIHNLVSKQRGSANKVNNARAAIQALVAEASL